MTSVNWLEWRRSRVGKLCGLGLLAVATTLTFAALVYSDTGNAALWTPIALLRAVLVAVVTIPFFIGFGKLFFGVEVVKHQIALGAVLGTFIALFDTFVSIAGLLFGDLASEAMPARWTIWVKAPAFAVLGSFLGFLATRERNHRGTSEASAPNHG
jgi:hypothetical protein